MNNELIKELCDTPGVPGCEDAISSIVSREIEESCVASLKDPMGNLIFQVNNTIPEAPTILIDAHMDEVGFIISHIEETGLKPALLRHSVYTLLRISIFEELKKKNNSNTLVEKMFIGGISGAVAQLVATPFDLLKVQYITDANYFN